MHSSPYSRTNFSLSLLCFGTFQDHRQTEACRTLMRERRIELAASRLRIECSAVRASRALECAAVTVSSRIPNLPAALWLFHCESLTVHQSFGRSNAPGESRTRIVPVTAYSLRRRGRYGSNKAGHAGFEPAASWLTTKRALRAAPMARGSACEIRTHDLQLEKLPA